MNYRFDGHNQPDQLVMNPNGRWYRQCQTGYYYSYFFGMKGMVIDEDFNFLSSGSQFAAVNNGRRNLLAGSGSSIHASGQLRGPHLQHAAGTSDGRETRVSLLPLDLGYARQCRHVPEHRPARTVASRPVSAGPASPTLADGTCHAQNTDNSFSASSNVVAFAGGFGVAGSYKFRPNLVGHVSYDMMWVGDIARAPEQMVFSSVPETARDNINTKGSVFYDGFSFGIELDW